MHQRTSPRRKEYDYTSSWCYFVTICTKDRTHYFGGISQDINLSCQEHIIQLSDIGIICKQELEIMINKRPSVDIHTSIIMPNHVHFLFVVNECRDTDLSCPIIKDDASIRPYSYWIITNQSLWSIIWWRKSAVTKQCRLKWLWFARQPRYHDHIVRNEDEYNKIKNYINTNPSNRNTDKFY